MVAGKSDVAQLIAAALSSQRQVSTARADRAGAGKCESKTEMRDVAVGVAGTDGVPGRCGRCRRSMKNGASGDFSVVAGLIEVVAAQ